VHDTDCARIGSGTCSRRRSVIKYQWTLQLPFLCNCSTEAFIGQNLAIPLLRACTPNIKLWFHQGGAMIERNVTLPEMILWTGTRVALGAGIGMLISRGLSKDAMKAAGLALTVVGGFTTIPLAISIMGKKNLTRSEIRSVA
jgi:hypothetical protein